MIFNLDEIFIFNEQKVLSTIIETCDLSYGFIINESNIKSSTLGAKKVNGQDRYIVIGNKPSEGPRLKVSKPGIKINDKTSHEDYVSIYSNNGEIKDKTDSKKAILKSKELKYYKDMYKRNENLIKLTIYKKNDLELIEKAFIDDEKRFINNIQYSRDENGNLTEIINGVEKHYDLRGKEI